MTKIQVIKGCWFKNHKATLTTHGDLQVLEWVEPGTNVYSCRYVFDDNKMYISGDIGNAVFELTWKADVHSFNQVGIYYFDEKLRAYSAERKEFNSHEAVKRIREWLKNIKNAGVEYDHDDMRELFEGARTSTERWEWVETIHRYDRFLSELDDDYCEWIYTCGDAIPARIHAYLIGLKMASEQLRGQ